MDTSWSNFLFQTPSTQSQPETPLQSELLPELSGSAQSPPAEHIASPPSTVDTAALSEDPLPVKPLIKPGRPAHICSTCNKEFKNSYNLRRHQSTPSLPHNAATGAETLPLLGQQQGGLQVAVSIAPATVTMAAPPPPIQAAVVVVGSLEQNPNPNPSNTNTVRKNHACEACGKAFRDVYHLNRHRLSHSDEKPYFCPVCQQRFKRKDRMSYHVRSHQGGVEKPYVCPHCAKAFSRPDHLNSHVRQVHSTERPFKCTTCTSAFATRDRLRAHLVRHEEKVPCHICGKLLSAAYITDHMRVHNQAQHHSCHLCNRSFTTLTYLRVHAQKHHGQEWKESGGARGGFGGTGAGGVLLCQLCGVQCKTATQLQGHMGTHAAQGDPGHDPSHDPTSAGPVGSTSVAVTVSSASSVGLLVTDCSGIAPSPHS
ncbi:hypothetical protein KUCAC02_007630 [Chaenocephalus aceratus]|uniref:Uncharacterized protein n=1 Tax=Chaenocephalus aceratus TaxID=36190 RepID=A0ACB9X649_CHAAC|nr:hypothetical protein KUCAC02_007630 [Chaenocephalus aceratus]